MWIRWIYDAIVHPFTFATYANNACPSQVRQMPRYFGLTLSQYFDEETHAHFVISNEVEQSQTRSVSQSPKQLVHLEFHSLFAHAVDSSTKHIRLPLYIGCTRGWGFCRYIGENSHLESFLNRCSKCQFVDFKGFRAIRGLRRHICSSVCIGHGDRRERGMR